MTFPVFGRYEVIKELGSGGMADVYLARDPELERTVAIKAPKEKEQAFELLRRFRHEAKAVATLRHRAIVPVFEFEENDGRPYLVMPYMPGGSLGDRLVDRTYMPAEALPIIERIAAALDHAHAKAIIHRDVKPGNILFDEDGDAYLSDFGIARFGGGDGEKTISHVSEDGKVRGTSAYMSPEQAIGRRATAQSDIYSLAVVLHQMLTGRLPYRTEDPEPEGVALATRQPAPPPAVGAIIDLAMKMEPTHRYRTAAALATDLGEVVAGRPPLFAPIPATDGDVESRAAAPEEIVSPQEESGAPVIETRSPRDNWRWGLIPGVILLLITGLWAVVALLPPNGGTPTPPPTVTVENVVTDDPIVGVTEPPPASATPVAIDTPDPPVTDSPGVTATLATSPPTVVAPTPATPTQTPTAPSAELSARAVASVFTRAGPGLEYTIDGSLSIDQVVPVIARDRFNSWYLVRLPGGRAAWVSRDYVAEASGGSLSDAAPAATIPPTPTPTATSAPPTAPPPTPATPPDDPGPPEPPPISPTATLPCLNPPCLP
jgi:serine/threonine-protein kinase